jgi:hypothetical protein
MSNFIQEEWKRLMEWIGAADRGTVPTRQVSADSPHVEQASRMTTSAIGLLCFLIVGALILMVIGGKDGHNISTGLIAWMLVVVFAYWTYCWFGNDVRIGYTGIELFMGKPTGRLFGPGYNWVFKLLCSIVEVTTKWVTVIIDSDAEGSPVKDTVLSYDSVSLSYVATINWIVVDAVVFATKFTEDKISERIIRTLHSGIEKLARLHNANDLQGNLLDPNALATLKWEMYEKLKDLPVFVNYDTLVISQFEVYKAVEETQEEPKKEAGHVSAYQVRTKGIQALYQERAEFLVLHGGFDNDKKGAMAQAIQDVQRELRLVRVLEVTGNAGDIVKGAGVRAQEAIEGADDV